MEVPKLIDDCCVDESSHLILPQISREVYRKLIVSTHCKVSDFRRLGFRTDNEAPRTPIPSRQHLATGECHVLNHFLSGQPRVQLN
jgi:hypothetical protein